MAEETFTYVPLTPEEQAKAQKAYEDLIKQNAASYVPSKINESVVIQDDTIVPEIFVPDAETTEDVNAASPQKVTSKVVLTQAAALSPEQYDVGNVVPEIKAAREFTTNNPDLALPPSWQNEVGGFPVVPQYKEFSSGEPGLRQSIGGADMSVFYVSEMPNIGDVLTWPDNPDAWKKEPIILQLDTALSLSYSTIRERFPVRVLGKSNPVAYTAGPRTIAGHIAFAILTNDVLTELRSYVKNTFENLYNSAKNMVTNYLPDVDTTAKYDAAVDEYMQEQLDKIRRKSAIYKAALDFNAIVNLDQLPPFNLLCMGVNEQGIFSKFMIRGVSIVDENQYQGTTQPNIVNKVSFVAQDVIPMAAFTRNSKAVTTSIGSITESFGRNGYTSSFSENVTSGTSILDSIEDDLHKDINLG